MVQFKLWGLKRTYWWCPPIFIGEPGIYIGTRGLWKRRVTADNQYYLKCPYDDDDVDEDNEWFEDNL